MILVTGASGFLGKHLVEALLSQGLPVRALYNKTIPNWEHPLLEWRACDLLDVYAVEEVMVGITQVYHCAAIVSFEKRDKQAVIHQNATATAHVVDEALNAGVSRLIHVSSIAALGRAAKPLLLIDEQSQWQESDLNTAYAQGKFQAEMQVWRAMAEGLNAAIINPGIILGEGDFSQGSAALFKTAYEEFPWYTEGVNGWVDVKDVVSAMILLMNTSEIVEKRFVLTENNHSYQSIFTWMAKAMDKKAPHKKAGPLMSQVARLLSAVKAMFTGEKSMLSKETVRTAQAKCYYDNKAFLALFPEFYYTPMEETIARVSKSFLKNI